MTTGIREQIKKASSLKEAEQLMREVYKLSLKAQRRCKVAFSQLPFHKDKEK